MIKEIKRVKYENVEFRLIDKPHIRIFGDKKYRYRWVVQARPEDKFRFDDFYMLRKKSEGLKMLSDEVELENLFIGYTAVREAMGVINRLVNF